MVRPSYVKHKVRVQNIYIYIYIYIYNTVVTLSFSLSLSLSLSPLSPSLTHTHQVDWGCIIYRLNLCRGVRPRPNQCLAYDIKPSEDEATILKIWGILRTPSLPLLPCSLCPGMIAPYRVLSMGQIEQTNDWCKILTDI